MKKTKKALILSSAVATTAVCASLIAGSTFALFTSNDSVDIAITAGNVSVTAEIDKTSVELTSMGEVMEGDVWQNGGTAGFSSTDVLELKYITPGDGVTFDITLTNASTVNVQYKVSYKVEGELADVLELSATGVEFDRWATWSVTADKEQAVTVSVELPEEVGDEYQSKTADISFAVYAAQGNAAVKNDPVVRKNLEKKIESGEITADARKLPEGMTLDFSGEKCKVVLADEEAVIYYGLYFDRAAAYNARQDDIADGTVTKSALESKCFSGYNIWYADYYGPTTVVSIEKDMDFEDDVWAKPLSFYGQIVDGNNHTFKNVKIVAEGDAGQAGLFTGSSRYQNMVVENVYADATKATGNSVSGCAIANSNAVLTNITVKNSVAVGGKYSGGLVGYGYCTIKECKVINTEVSATYKAGGLIGFNDSSIAEGNSIINNTLQKVTVKVENLLEGKEPVVGVVIGHLNHIGTVTGNTATDIIGASDLIGLAINGGQNSTIENNSIN